MNGRFLGGDAKGLRTALEGDTAPAVVRAFRPRRAAGAATCSAERGVCGDGTPREALCIC